MASQLKIEKDDRKPYEESVKEPNIPLEETAIRAVITSWAKFQQPDGGEWIYSWN